MVSEFFPGLSQSYSQLLDDSDDYNIIIKVGENPNTKEFHAHSNILKARSPYFKRALSQYSDTEENDMIIFTIANISPNVFEMIIRFIYIGIIDLSKKVGSFILELLVASEELLIEELVTFVQKYLIENQAKWLHQNFVKVLHTVFQLESCKILQNYCLETICYDPEPFFKSPTLEKCILLELIKSEDLQMEEIEIWNYLIKWGINQTPELREKSITDLSNWNKKDILALKDTLNQFIMYIRFLEISSKDFHSIIWPFKKVLPQALFEDIVSFHMSNTEPKQNKLIPRYKLFPVDSMIIKPKHAAIIVNWIQRKDSNAGIPRDCKYNLNLIYRRSRDGYDLNNIRRICDGQGACILIIKTKENETIIGGYNPIGWSYNQDYEDYDNYYMDEYDYDGYHSETGEECYWNATSESFIFSLGDGKDLSNIIISRVANNGYAIYESNFIPLNFGNSDLVIKNDFGTCNQAQYESNILDNDNFTIEEMEIFSFNKS